MSAKCNFFLRHKQRKPYKLRNEVEHFVAKMEHPVLLKIFSEYAIFGENFFQMNEYY